jgi:NAD(P)-dependent dehydrogenase (short-subunit alcohol dehydrogenase family)
VLPPTVLVTGAAKRLGREIALKLAAHGWRVAVHFRDSVEEARQTVADCALLTPGAQAFRSNLGNETAVRNLLPTVVAAFGRVDAVVNCASTFEHDTAATFSFAAMEKHMRSNAGAAILIGQALHTHIAGRQKTEPDARGVVVNLLDQKLWNQTPDFVSYTLSKAALDAANSMLALALSPLVRVVGVAPVMGQHQPLLKGEKLEERSASLPHQQATDLDTKAAVLLALQDGSISGTTLLVEEELSKDKPPAPQPEPPAPFVPPARRHGRR